jgi:hypothetical protein
MSEWRAVRWRLYRALMKLAHRYDWHYAPMIEPIAPEGDMQLWCKWCGFRQTVKQLGDDASHKACETGHERHAPDSYAHYAKPSRDVPTPQTERPR